MSRVPNVHGKRVSAHHCFGNSFEMGYQHGRQAAPLIQKYISWIERFTGKPRAELAAAAMWFLPMIQKLNRAYVDEVMGLAEEPLRSV